MLFPVKSVKKISSQSGSSARGMDRWSFAEEFNIKFHTDEAFFFIIGYDENFYDIIPYNHCADNGVFFSTASLISECSPTAFLPPLQPYPETIFFKKNPISFEKYAEQFTKVREEINHGNTYLLNLTTETPIHTNLSLGQIFALSNEQVPYRLWYRDHFVSFSPESFVTVADGIISAFPMKGTYLNRESAEAACEKMNPKEYWEQTTVVDRVRNDLSLICPRVRVEKFLDIKEVETCQGKIYQTVSEVTGELGDNFYHDPARSLLALLPAASITGAPRSSTIAIIRDVETHNRNFYTGVWGVCCQGKIDSSVIIRYLEKRKGHLYYKSGGGITFMSIAEMEYQEMIDKIYLPFAY